jgi:predicted nucleic acid-binding protein
MFVEGVIDRFPLLPVDLRTARVHAEVWADLAAKGRLIGAHDLWLAAACLAHDLTLATANGENSAACRGSKWRTGLRTPTQTSP